MFVQVTQLQVPLLASRFRIHNLYRRTVASCNGLFVDTYYFASINKRTRVRILFVPAAFCCVLEKTTFQYIILIIYPLLEQSNIRPLHENTVYPNRYTKKQQHPIAINVYGKVHSKVGKSK